MVQIPEHGDPTLQAMYRAMEKGQSSGKKAKQSALGAGAIGRPCVREIWYGYNAEYYSEHEASTLMLFEDGHRTEALTAERLQAIPGIELEIHKDKKKKNQFGFDAFGGKFKGRYDGKIRGLLQAPKTQHIWEHKTSSEKKFNEFQVAKQYGEKKALKEWNFEYYVTANLYMHYENLTRHYMTVAYAGGREYDSCRTEYNEVIAEQYIDRAYKIIQAKEPPERISEDPIYYICKWCDHRSACHGV